MEWKLDAPNSHNKARKFNALTGVSLYKCLKMKNVFYTYFISQVG